MTRQERISLNKKQEKLHIKEGSPMLKDMTEGVPVLRSTVSGLTEYIRYKSILYKKVYERDIAGNAAIDVTLGKNPGDDFRIDDNKLVVEGDRIRVGIGTNIPDTMLHVAGSFNAGLVTLTADTSITAVLHAGRILLMGEVGGNAEAVFTLPDATGTGCIYKFIVSVVNTSNYIIKVSDASHVIDGSVILHQNGVDTVVSFNTLATSDTITLDATTTGGKNIGDEITLTDIASNQWAVKGVLTASGTEATPFSATVS